MDPTLTVLTYSTLAAVTAGLGPLPLIGRERIPLVAIGWANAVAAGFMLGAAHLLMVAGMQSVPAWGALGAVIGILLVWLSHEASGTGDLDLTRLDQPGELYAYKVMLVNTVHSAPEGVAIGAAMAVDVPFGIFVALAMALHNVPEAAVLSAILRERGLSLTQAAALSIVTNSSQVLLAVATFAIVSAAPWALAWALGFAVGGMIYLVMAEHLPECYRRTGHTMVALVTLVTMGIVVLLGGPGQ